MIAVLDEMHNMTEDEKDESNKDLNEDQSVDVNCNKEEQELWEIIDWESISEVVERKSATECLKRYLKLDKT